MPISKLIELKKTLGIKLFNKVYYGETSDRGPEQSDDGVEEDGEANQSVKVGQLRKKPIFKRSNEKRPREESSTRKASKFRHIPNSSASIKTKKFDPRFSAVCGDFDEIQFRKNYGFLGDLRKNEITALKKSLRVTRRNNPEMATKIKKNILRLENQERAARDARLMEETRAEIRQTNIERMRHGQRPLLLNNRDLKEKFLEKKRNIADGFGLSSKPKANGEQLEKST